jgi:hypothetical protein
MHSSRATGIEMSEPRKRARTGDALVNETIALAHERLSAAFRRSGHTLGQTSGVIEGVTVHDPRGRYLFAWHKNPRHLLFYVRMPALEAQSTLRQKALSRHPRDQVSRNPSGETTITIYNDDEAEMLLGWLMPALPLP